MPQLIATVKGVEVKHVYLHKDRTTLGRKPNNDIVLDTMVVSGQHCAFELVGVADVYLQDLGGTSAPLLNGQAMGSDPVMLSDQDVLDLAGTRMRFHLRE